MRWTTMAPYGIMPVPNNETRPYWEGAKEGKLMLQRCQSCGYYNHPPVYLCGGCCDREARLAFEQVSGKGTIYTWYMCHDTSINGYEDKVPYPVILVEINEQPGLTLMSNLFNCEVGELGEGIEVGAPVEVVFDKASDDIYVPQWQPTRR